MVRKPFQDTLSDQVLRANVELEFNVVCFFDINFQRLAKILAKKLTGFTSRADCRIKEFIHKGLTIDGSTWMSSPSKSIGFRPPKMRFGLNRWPLRRIGDCPPRLILSLSTKHSLFLR